ncbi:MAG: hypothetical protein MUO68_21920 [Desulfobacteraceae bacterium]|nr:hypothetical protein [Desulfobacteraceae bacterium]
MRPQRNWLNALVVVTALGLALAGCAALQKNDVMGVEGLLTKAGFRKMPADTPQKLAHLKSLPQNKIIRRTSHGNPYIVYADASNCVCMFVGNETNLRHYRDLEIQQNENPVELLNQPGIVTGEDWSNVWGPSN